MKKTTHLLLCLYGLALPVVANQDPISVEMNHLAQQIQDLQAKTQALQDQYAALQKRRDQVSVDDGLHRALRANGDVIVIPSDVQVRKKAMTAKTASTKAGQKADDYAAFTQVNRFVNAQTPNAALARAYAQAVGMSIDAFSKLSANQQKEHIDTQGGFGFVNGKLRNALGAKDVLGKGQKKRVQVDHQIRRYDTTLAHTMARKAVHHAAQQGKRPEEVLKTIADPQLRKQVLTAIDILEGRKSAHGYVPFVNKNREQGYTLRGAIDSVLPLERGRVKAAMEQEIRNTLYQDPHLDAKIKQQNKDFGAFNTKIDPIVTARHEAQRQKHNATIDAMGEQLQKDKGIDYKDSMTKALTGQITEEEKKQLPQTVQDAQAELAAIRAKRRAELGKKD